MQRSFAIFTVVVGVVGILFGFVYKRPVSIFGGILGVWAGFNLLDKKD